LTEAGRSLHVECQPLLQGLQFALGRAGTTDGALSGVLRISASVDHAVQWCAPALAQFAALHPALHIDLRTSDRVVDLVGEGIDVAIRMGWLRESSLRAVKLGEFEQYLLAAPSYLKKRGTPQRPADLPAHDWLTLSLLPAPMTWKLSARGKTETVHMKSRIKVDSPGALRAMLGEGAGISALDQFSAQQEIASGRLVKVLEKWHLPTGGIYAVMPPGRHTVAKVRRFVEFYRDYLAGAGKKT
jgi:DNA-binding transcriptional LysR family regulator